MNVLSTILFVIVFIVLMDRSESKKPQVILVPVNRLICNLTPVEKMRDSFDSKTPGKVFKKEKMTPSLFEKTSIDSMSPNKLFDGKEELTRIYREGLERSYREGFKN